MNKINNFNNMKRIKELTRDEVIALSEEQLSFYLSFELAANGLPIDILDKKQEEIKRPEPVKRMFAIDGVDYAFEKGEDVEKFADIISKAKPISYYLDENFDRYYYEDKTGKRRDIKKIDIYDNDDIKRFEEELRKVKSDEESSKDLICKARNIRADFINYIEEIKDERQINEYLKEELGEFVKMCDGDKGKAIEMMRGIYKFNDETEGYLLEDRC